MAQRCVNGVTYYYELCGPATAPPLLLLHGFTGSVASWRGHLPALAASHRVLAVDILGHGRTAAPADAGRYRMDRVAADLVGLMEALAIPATAAWGYSMGGRLALYTAVHFPRRVTRLVLESASPGLATAEQRQARRDADDALAAWIETHGIEAFVDRWERLPLWSSQAQLAPAVRAALRAQRLRSRPGGLAHSLRGMGAGAQPSLWPALSRLAPPLLLLVGALDEKFVSINRRMADLVLKAELAVVDHAGHAVHLEQPEQARQRVIRFLAQAEPAPGAKDARSC